MPLQKIIDRQLDQIDAAHMGVAVSGGGDSVALLLLLHRWAKNADRQISVVTVNHGLRDGAAGEVAFVANLCAQLGISHDVLYWQGWDRSGNLQNEARLARNRLISKWAGQKSIKVVATGHTKDDQAETFLMRLARGSGVDGLAAMTPMMVQKDLTWIRPVLGVTRQSLRDYLRSNKTGWIEDPSNDDRQFDRVRMRQAAEKLAELGLTSDVLADTAARMQSARIALELATREKARAIATPRASGSVRLDRAAFLDLTEELQLRLLAHCLRWVSGAVYRPRLEALKRVVGGLGESRAQTLAGCIVAKLDVSEIEICREENAVAQSTDQSALFDGRWRIAGPEQTKVVVLRTIGADGILLRPDWRQSGETRNTILSTPSIWYNNELMSVPLLDKDCAWTCKLENGVESFFSSILTH